MERGKYVDRALRRVLRFFPPRLGYFGTTTTCAKDRITSHVPGEFDAEFIPEWYLSGSGEAWQLEAWT